ncbi:hypothetical protein QUF74_16765 [Candidatus Halobeggiatoa sp. HSG11]|nr:hypothetical protein [Candidatus Halobeggiatoa sp. HSG11]
MKDLRFNRIIRKGQSVYLNDFAGIRKFDDFKHEGFIKCKLVHHDRYSIVVPDQIYFKAGSELFWIQPLFFSGILITCYGLEFYVDISHGVCLRIRFKKEDAISWLEDGSILYKCQIKGSKILYPYRTGKAKIEDGVPFIKLFHHTTQDAKKNIDDCSEFWSSSWNIQGNKKSTNISYLYLTSLSKISNIGDLEQIAMSSQGKLGFRIDSNFTSIPDLILTVYRESTNNRTHTLSYWVNTVHLAIQPCHRHMPPDNFGYHAIVSPFVHRIGVDFGTTVSIVKDSLLPKKPKLLGYAVVGGATTIDGLSAPYDEENTDEKLKIEYMKQPVEIIRFWVENANSNQVDNKIIEEVEF